MLLRLMYNYPAYVWVRWFFWGNATILLGPLIAHMWRRGLHSRFPVFFGFLIWSVLRFFVAFYLHTSHYYVAFFEFHFYADALESLLLLFVAHELCNRLFANFDGLRSLSRFLFRWGTGVMILIAVAVAATRNHTDLDPELNALTSLDTASKFLIAGMVFLLFLISSYFGMAWPRYSQAIAAGIALYMSVGIIDHTSFSLLGKVAGPTMVMVDNAAYFCSCLIWVVYLRASERTVTPPSHAPKHNLDKWNATLQELLAR